VFFVFPSSISVFPKQNTKTNIEMKTKIPPPILALIMIALIYISSLFIETTTFNYQGLLSILFLILGLACLLPSFKLFAKFKTTITPLKPSNSTALVTEGLYRYSRNPMYLGLLLITIASTIWFGTWLGITINIVFIFLINFLQIIPEEEALLEIFGEEYEEYKKNVRRWI
jgi:protein-S-isoprenylcysteine O-methyltransferase Ste14